jgi:hypothetical protein
MAIIATSAIRSSSKEAAATAMTGMIAMTGVMIVAAANSKRKDSDIHLFNLTAILTGPTLSI